jgi:aryl-alcohol dehydrogenase-like predicted oxidoreductase
VTGPVSAARRALASRFDLSLSANQRKLDAAEQLAELADKAGMPLIEMAIAFVLRHPAGSDHQLRRRRGGSARPCRRSHDASKP